MPTLAQNKQATFNYEILSTLEAGIVLTGAEVKSIRAKNVNLKNSYIAIEEQNVLLKKCHISPYSKAPDQLKTFDPEKNRILLLHRKEIDLLAKQIALQGLTLIPLEIYLSKGRLKIKIALAKGKKVHDKRQSLKEKAQNRDINRTLKHY